MDEIFPEFNEFHTKVVFYRIPKNASTSIYDHLGSSNLIASNKEVIDKRADKRIYKDTFEPSHLKPDELKDLLLGENLKYYFSFCVVRNPWDRALSMYLHAIENDFKTTYGIKGDVDFDFFCNYLKDRKDDPYFIGSHKQTDWIKGKYPPREILRFENIHYEFSEMIINHNILGISAKLPHKNKTEHSHYSCYYNSERKDIISEVFEEDVDTFKYSFSKAVEVEKKEGFLNI